MTMVGFLSGILVSLSLFAVEGRTTQPASAPATQPAAIQTPVEGMEVPVIDGDWWKIADNAPDVSPYNTKYHNACDFSIWQAADGTWQMAACIRETSFPGGTRLFHHWEAKNLTDQNWTPKGIFAASDPKIGHKEGGMQAPHCFKEGGKWYFFYNSRGAYCKMSEDGKQFTDIKDAAGNYKFFDMGRDVMLFHDGDTWYAYYCGNLPKGHPNSKPGSGAMVARTARDLLGPWSKEEVVVRSEGNPESPFVLKRGDWYYLWQQSFVYASKNPLDFNGQPISRIEAKRDKYVAGVPSVTYAPEVIVHEGQYYVSGYARGIWQAKMKWAPRTAEEIRKWRADTYNVWRERTPEEKAIEAVKLKAYHDRVKKERAAEAEKDKAASQPGK